MERIDIEKIGKEQINMLLNDSIFLGRVENIVGKGKKYLLTAFYPFPTLFSKAFFPRVLRKSVSGNDLYLQIFSDFYKFTTVLVWSVTHYHDKPLTIN